MSKIVCDVCGSSYSETEMQCPICGTAKSEAAKPAVETNGEESAAKGGKFSKPNNRKTGVGASLKKPGNNKSEEGAPSNLAMIIIVAVLLIAIVAVCIFIAVRIFGNPDQPDNPSTSSTSTTAAPDPTFPCTGLELVGIADNKLAFTSLTQSVQLNVKPVPENTTDTVVLTYTSSDPAVVVVDQTGLVTPVASGNATITVTYGSHSVTVEVTCDIPKPITELKLNLSDVTLSPANGLSVTLTVEGLDASDVIWTSADESVAIVDNGVVTAVSNKPSGVIITATYGDLTATCLVRVKNMAEKAYLLTTGYTTGAEIQVTLTMGSDETFLLKLVNKETQEEVTGVEWVFSNDFPKCCTWQAEGNAIRITAVADTSEPAISGGYVLVQAKYQGETYRCKIFVKPAQTQE